MNVGKGDGTGRRKFNLPRVELLLFGRREVASKVPLGSSKVDVEILELGPLAFTLPLDKPYQRMAHNSLYSQWLHQPPTVTSATTNVDFEVGRWSWKQQRFWHVTSLFLHPISPRHHHISFVSQTYSVEKQLRENSRRLTGTYHTYATVLLSIPLSAQHLEQEIHHVVLGSSRSPKVGVAPFAAPAPSDYQAPRWLQACLLGRPDTSAGSLSPRLLGAALIPRLRRRCRTRLWRAPFSSALRGQPINSLRRSWIWSTRNIQLSTTKLPASASRTSSPELLWRSRYHQLCHTSPNSEPLRRPCSSLCRSRG